MREQFYAEDVRERRSYQLKIRKSAPDVLATEITRTILVTFATGVPAQGWNLYYATNVREMVSKKILFPSL